MSPPQAEGGIEPTEHAKYMVLKGARGESGMSRQGRASATPSGGSVRFWGWVYQGSLRSPFALFCRPLRGLNGYKTLNSVAA